MESTEMLAQSDFVRQMRQSYWTRVFWCVFFRDPERGWDRSKVKGLLANLITVSDISYSTALEVVAGGRLYNIVVDTEVGVLLFFFVFFICRVVGQRNLSYWFYFVFVGDW